jgi:AcrR family transcriptional regulator
MTGGRQDTGEVVSADDRERALSAARRLLTRSGLHGLKVENLIAESGLSNRAFYRQFSDKQDLLRALIQEQYDHMAERSREIFANAGSDLDGVKAWVEWMISLADDDAHNLTAGLLLYRQEARLAYPEPVMGAVDKVVDVLADALRRLRDQGHPFLHPRLDASALYLLTISVLQQRLMAGSMVDAATGLAIVWPFVERSLTWHPAGP